jgi:hypothetical protein
VWLDTELLWFREGIRIPALAGLAPAPLPSFGPPPGLVASRTRRAAKKRRRTVRRVGAAALVISPAVLLPVKALRSESGSRIQLEDPPSLTFRLNPPGEVGSIFVPRHEAPISRGAGAKPKHESSARRAELYPKVEWHSGISVGLPYEGHLIGGTQLPIDGPNWVTWDPVTDSVPNQPDRLYGNEHTIHTIISVIDAYRIADPGAPRVVVGDISLKGGGPMTDEHVSHQNGLDVDIYYPRLDGTLRAPTAVDQIDRKLAQDLLDRFVAAGAQMIFVGYDTGLHGPSGVVIPYPNHDNHMHVRFPPPGG